jgi:PAS domain S-box-containing protein
MNTTATQSLRVIALGRFSAELPPLSPHLAALKVEPYRCESLEQLPALRGHDILLTELAWLNGLALTDRKALGQRARNAAGWIALSDKETRFKELVDWQRTGISHFFQKPLDPARLATLVEDIHDRLSGPPLRVILLDDDASALGYYSEVLQKAGVITQATQDPLIALDIIEEFRPDLLLVDIEMPGCRGPELVTIVRQKPECALLPVIFLTAMEGMQDLLSARQAAAEDFLAKPVDPKLLLTAVHSHARRHRSHLRADAHHWHAEVQARLRLEQLRAAIDEHSIVSIADAKGNIIHVNDKFCAVSGYSRDELLGQNHRLVKSSLHTPDFYSGLWNTITGGKVWHGEVCNRRKDGEFYWVDATIVPFLDSKGKPQQYISIRTDITEVKRHEKELKESEERLRRSQVFANIGTWDWNIQTGELYWSERIAPLFGHHTGELETTYENFLNAVHPDDRQAVIDAVGACVESNAPYELEHRVVWPDGQVRWLLERGAVVRDAENKPLHMLGVVQDIHERKMAEAALAESERRLREAQSIAHIGHWQADLASGNVVWSLEIYRIFGRDPEHFSPTIAAFYAATHPDDVAKVQQAQLLAMQAGKGQVNSRILRPDGTLRHVQIVARTECDESGNVRYLIGTIQDITEQVDAEEHLRLFRRIFDASEQAVGITDSEGRMIYMNRAHEEILGYTGKDVLGKPFATFMPDEEKPRVASEVMAAAKAGKGWSGLHTVQRKDGSTFVASSNVGFVKSETGEIQYLFNIFTDFTEELARRNELALAKEAAERASQAKSDFLSSMSHELRTPLNAIIGFSQMLEYDSSLNADQLDNVHEILKAGRHLLDLINEVLDLAKIESGRIDLSIEAVDLGAIADDCQQLIQPLIAARQLSLTLDIPPGAAVRGDRVRLKQVLLNLLSNAVKYNHENGSIRLAVAPSNDNRVRIAVIDTGPGIPQERFAELFQPFNRLNAEHSEVEGTGIGLTITRRLVEMMGGEIGVESEVGRGSTFWIELPADEKLADQTVTGATSDSSHSDGAAREYRVLCIDDNPANLKLVAQVLGMRAHIHLTTAHSPELGIELALAHRPDLILLDINMPHLDGYQVLEIFKADSRLKGVPVVAITANALPRDIARGTAAGFAAYLTKPLNIEQFLKTIDACLKQEEKN